LNLANVVTYNCANLLSEFESNISKTLEIYMKTGYVKGLSLLVMLVALAGCSSTKMAAVSTSPSASIKASAQLAPAQATVKSVVATSPLDDPKSPLAKRSVFFDFDGYQIHQNDLALIEAHAKYMTTNKSAKVRLEGNADEKGGREYNLALGQRRAEAVRKSLVLLGVSDANLEAISYGMEKPIDSGHSEEAWAKNRRVDLKYIAR
jgi:peptidoglycan-associated lipoprotein